MYHRIKIDNVRFQAASPTEVKSGLLGWVSCVLNQSLKLNDLAVRRTRSNRLALSFPARTTKTGRQRFYLHPLDDRSRREIERQVFEAIAMKGESL